MRYMFKEIFTSALFMSMACYPAIAGKLTWNLKQLSTAPKVYPATKYAQPGVKAIFYQGPEYNGRPTTVFAYVGMPEKRSGKVPAMVLVHGGAGTAIPEWVRIWNKRGYAAIAMDTCGAISINEKRKTIRNKEGGPGGWGSFGQMYYGSPKDRDLWTWQAVAQIILANSLLRSMPEVDQNRIGITGISWGGYLTCIAAAADNRFKIAIPVYGCGFLYETPRYKGIIDKKAKIKQRWLTTCDPSLYIANAKMPFLWLNGTNDFAFTLNAWQKTYQLQSGGKTLCVRKNMPHGYVPGWSPKEIYAFADMHLKNTAKQMVAISGHSAKAGKLVVKYESGVPPAKAVMFYTKSRNSAWNARKWQEINANIDYSTCKAIATIPSGSTACFMNLYSKGGLITSSPHVELPQ